MICEARAEAVRERPRHADDLDDRPAAQIDFGEPDRVDTGISGPPRHVGIGDLDLDHLGHHVEADGLAFAAQRPLVENGSGDRFAVNADLHLGNPAIGSAERLHEAHPRHNRGLGQGQAQELASWLIERRHRPGRVEPAVHGVEGPVVVGVGDRIAMR